MTDEKLLKIVTWLGPIALAHIRKFEGDGPFKDELRAIVLGHEKVLVREVAIAGKFYSRLGTTLGAARAHGLGVVAPGDAIAVLNEHTVNEALAEAPEENRYRKGDIAAWVEIAYAGKEHHTLDGYHFTVASSESKRVPPGSFVLKEFPGLNEQRMWEDILEQFKRLRRNRVEPPEGWDDDY